jgi:hypothetical protein
MKKKTNLDRPYVLLTALAAIVFVILGMSAPISAQNQKPQFKVGDRVEVDTLYTTTPETSTYWRKGTIAAMDDPEMHFGHYTIKLDEPGTDPKIIRFVDTQWIRALKAGGANRETPVHLGPAVQVAQAGCPSDPGINIAPSASAPLEQKIKHLIWEQYSFLVDHTLSSPSAIGVKFQDFQMSSVKNNFDPLTQDTTYQADVGAAVTLVHTHYTVCLQYKDGNKVRHYDGHWAAFVDRREHILAVGTDAGHREVR